MKPTRVAEVLERLVLTRWPAFVWGPPGVGKSSVVAQVAEKLGRRVVDIRASLLDPTDIRGIPSVQNGVARWCPPSFLPTEAEPGVLFFDELSSAPPLVQASLYQLTLDRRAGEYELPDGWSIVAAGNRSQDGSIVFRMPAALANRFVHLDYEVDFDDWRAWATTHGLSPIVVAFVGYRRNLLFDFRNHDRAFPSPRSWEMASDTLKAFGQDVHQAEDVLQGVVGEGATVELMAFLGDTRVREVVAAILADPAAAPLPTRLDQVFAVISYLASSLEDKRALEASLVLLDRLTPELAIVLLRDLAHIRPKCMTDPRTRAFIRRHRADIQL